MHLDRDLAIVIYPKAADLIPGDARYFSNPDVDPLTPQWQGENAYYLGGGLYYGHGIGVTNADGIIRALNRARKKDATQSAFLNEMVKRQDYRQLASYM
jgi:protein-glutamine gamma-glutamyltransferase